MPNERNQQPHGGKGLIDKVQDAIGAAVGKASASTVGSRSAKAFVQNAVASNLYEIESARIAMERSPSQEVRSFAQRMVKDHQTLGDKLKHAMPQIEGVDLTEEKLDNRRQGMIDNLRSAPADAFDKRYLDQQFAAHKEAVALFRGYSENGDNAQLKGLAAADLPVLQAHLDHVNRLRGH